MRLIIATIALVALLPFALTAPTSTDLSDTAPDTTLGDTFDDTFDDTSDDTPNEALDDTPDLLPRGRKPPKPKIPPISIRTYLQAGCGGTPWYFPKVHYHDLHLANYTSYSISRDLLPGEVLDILGNGGKELYNDMCAMVTSHTPQGLKKGCYELGGDSKGKVATCFRLWNF
ncbi:MAG: hypothetical protein LQ346_007570 [Caloplaca aetnensis]|nr:MAG: hypothetical protein LQ346_007570 [Caloplaca aetnensis]